MKRIISISLLSVVLLARYTIRAATITFYNMTKYEQKPIRVTPYPGEYLDLAIPAGKGPFTGNNSTVDKASTDSFKDSNFCITQITFQGTSYSPGNFWDKTDPYTSCLVAPGESKVLYIKADHLDNGYLTTNPNETR